MATFFAFTEDVPNAREDLNHFTEINLKIYVLKTTGIE